MVVGQAPMARACLITGLVVVLGVFAATGLELKPWSASNFDRRRHQAMQAEAKAKGNRGSFMEGEVVSAVEVQTLTQHRAKVTGHCQHEAYGACGFGTSCCGNMECSSSWGAGECLPQQRQLGDPCDLWSGSDTANCGVYVADGVEENLLCCQTGFTSSQCVTFDDFYPSESNHNSPCVSWGLHGK